LSRRILRVVKPEIRILGVDDGQFRPHSNEQVPVVGVVFRGGYWLDGFMCTTLTVDGLDSTERITVMIVESPHYRQLRVVVLNGITFGGFNVVDIQALHEQTKLPIIAVTQKKPNLKEVHDALKHLPQAEERWRRVQSAGEIWAVAAQTGKKRVFLEVAGVSVELAQTILKLTSTRSNIPEALRVAHLVASGLKGCQR
jgi:uncharacterized protein